MASTKTATKRRLSKRSKRNQGKNGRDK